jgi:hypothetical protein
MTAKPRLICFTLYAFVTVTMCEAQQLVGLVPSKVQVVSDRIDIQLVNTSRKTIRNFCMAMDASRVLLQEVLPPHDGILPGATFVTSVESTPAHAANEAKAFTITCAVFNDGTNEGLPKHVQMMKELRAGRAYQTERLAALVNELYLHKDTEIDGAIREAVARVTAADITRQDGTPASGLFANGMRSANTVFLRDLVRATDHLVAGDVRAARDQLLSARTKYQRTKDLTIDAQPAVQ